METLRSGANITYARTLAAFILWTVACMILSPLGPALAQQPTATILGVVKDSSGAVVPGATVTVTNTETGVSRAAQTGNDGAYRFPALAVGSYDLKTEHTGFQSVVQHGLRITVGAESVIHFTLTVGAVAETISVTAEAPIVNTTSGSLSGLVTEQKVADLPLNGRNFNDLTLLQTGVNESRTSGTGGSINGTQYSSNGAPTRSNNFTIDGTIMNDLNNSGPASTNENTLGVEGIREFRVVTNSFSAEYGMNMGSQVMLVTKSGSNQLRGSLFEFLRNSALDARNWTDGSEQPGFLRNNFGGSVGGPVRQDRTFYFLNYEGLRQTRTSTSLGTTPTAEARRDGVLAPTVAEAVKPYLALLPLPNGETLTGGLGRYSNTIADVQREDFGQARLDQNISSSDSFFARYTLDDAADRLPAIINGVFTNFSTRNQWLTLSESHIFSPELLSTFRASFSRTHYVAMSNSLDVPGLNFAAGQQIGTLGISGVTDIGPPGVTPNDINQRVFSTSDDLFHVRGKHSLKVGALINQYRQYMLTATNIRGAWSFSSLANFLQGRATQFQVYTPGGWPDRTYDYATLGFYLQDDWRVSPTVTLNVGLRYEFTTQYKEIRGYGSAVRDIRNDTAATLGIPFENPSRRNLSPRVGFAWDVFGDGRTALRGGAGLLYDVGTFGSALFLGVTGTPPFSTQSVISPVAPATTIAFGPQPVIPAGAAGRSLRTVDFHMQQPHLLSYNLTVERQLPFDLGLTLAYAGSRGINLMQTKEGNPTVPRGVAQGNQCVAPAAPIAFVAHGPKCWLAGETRTNPAWETMDFRTAAGNSWYNSLQFGLVKRLENGLQFQSSYTYSKVLDDTQGQLGVDDQAGGTTGDDPSNRRFDQGAATFDLRHQWRLNAIYRLPADYQGLAGTLLNGWWVSGILTWNSGFPFVPSMSTQVSRSLVGGNNGGQRRPHVIPGADADQITRGGSLGCTLGTGATAKVIAAGTPLGTPQLFFDPCAFALPAAGFLGNSARGLIYGPNFSTMNFSLVKDTRLGLFGENGAIQFRTEIFNVLNHPSFGVPARNVNVTTAGLIQSTLSRSREIQFALKVLF